MVHCPTKRTNPETIQFIETITSWSGFTFSHDGACGGEIGAHETSNKFVSTIATSSKML